MAKWMTIKDALEEFDLLDLFNDILESYGEEKEDPVFIESELRDLLEEHEEEYEFVPDPDDDYSESFERNLKEALVVISEEEGLRDQDDFSEDALDDVDIEDIYENGIDDERVKDPRGHGADADEFDEFDGEEDFY
ncbi:hypothetical protein [Desulfospira joergensenii]|uniref:hypothetical protein n=1 Tax=Desulfospira joergensenii TaxID=53329 RepID=UPI0003B78403|nr:hypothetical protein [Desulfospira joergensenii]